MTTSSYTMPEKGDGDAAAELLALAVEHQGETPFEIDAAPLESIDGAMTLTLANIAHTFAARGRPLAVVGASPILIEAFQDLGLHEQLMKMEFKK